MNRIFLVLAVLSNIALGVTFALGWRIDDPGSLAPAARDQVAAHFLIALGSIILALLVQAVVLTYFMGTGRWIEETCEAYGFTEAARAENMRLKYQVLPGLFLCLTLLIVTGAFGAISDPASNIQMPSAHTIHFVLASCALTCNIAVSCWQFVQISRNSQVVEQVYAEVRKVRQERGLDVVQPESV